MSDSQYKAPHVHEFGVAVEHDRGNVGKKIVFTDFKFDEIDSNLGLEEPGNPIRELMASRQERDIVAKHLTKVLAYFAASETVSGAGCRALCWTWLISPALFKETSLQKVAETRGSSKQSLHRYLKVLGILFPDIKPRNHHKKKKAGRVAALPAKEVETDPTTEGSQQQ